LAKAYLKDDQWENAIISSQNYIFENENEDKIEDLYFIIAEAYLSRKIYKRALNTLEYLRTSKYIHNQIPLLFYKIGNCYEFMSKYSEALKYYKKLKLDFPYDPYTYLAEDRIFQLKQDKDIRLPEITAKQNKTEKIGIMGLIPKVL